MKTTYSKEIKAYATEKYVTTELSKEKVLEDVKETFGDEVAGLHLSTIDSWSKKFEWVKNRKEYQNNKDEASDVFDALVQASGEDDEAESLSTVRNTMTGFNKLEEILETALDKADFSNKPGQAGSLYLGLSKSKKGLHNEAVNQTTLSAILYNGLKAIEECVTNTIEQNNTRRRWSELNKINGVNLLPKLDNWLGM